MRIVVICSAAETIIWHRGELIRDMSKLGHEVIALAPDDAHKWREPVEEFGCTYFQIYMEKTGMNVLADLKCRSSIRHALDIFRPDCVFLYHSKPICYGAVAAQQAGVSDIFAIVTGLGSVLRGDSARCRAVRPVLGRLYQKGLSCCKKVFFQNHDDYEFMLKNKMISEQSDVTFINGSGVNMSHFKAAPLQNKLRFLFLGRLLRDKGIFEYLEAAEIVKAKYPHAEFMVAGGMDSNPTAAKFDDLAAYIDKGTVDYLGRLDDVRPAISECDVFVLPSYHEGTPKSVLEAMSMGRAVLTTDAPGCRETVLNGYNGWLVPTRNSRALAERMTWMIENESERIRMGTNSVTLCEEKFKVEKVNATILKAMGLEEEKRVPAKITSITTELLGAAAVG
jgi:glycosyltransferase involved in cell wall biosynthesis